MESYGEILRATREEKNITFENIERETNIARNYIEAIENESVDSFPGEVYFLGFLRNYCEFLGLDINEIMKLYHAKKIQEAPVPEELLHKEKSKLTIYLIIFASILAVVGLVLYLYFGVFKVPQRREEKKVAMNEIKKIHQYTFSGKLENKRLYVGDQIFVPTEDGSSNIVLTVSNTLSYLTLKTPSGDQVITLSEERDLDVTGDGKGDFILYLSDISDMDASYGAEIRMFKKETQDVEEPIVQDTVLAEQNTSMENIKQISGKRTVILEDTRAYPFTLKISFRGSCLFRYKVDRQPNYEEYFSKNDIINITANNGFRLWMSNVNALSIQIIAANSTYDLEVGKAGEVKVEDIKWVRDSDGKYRLVVLEID